MALHIRDSFFKQTVSIFYNLFFQTHLFNKNLLILLVYFINIKLIFKLLKLN